MTKRAGVTEKISISIDRADLAILRKRAKRLHGGNLSAVIAEMIARAKQQEALAGLIDWLGGPSPMTKERADEIDRQILGVPRTSKPKATPRGKRRAAA